jgi:signal transduction histidine kinase
MERLMDRALGMLSEPLRASAWNAPSLEELRTLRAFIDLEAMARCLANVLTNALESGRSEVAVTVNARVRDNYLQLEVSDNGNGIAPEDLPLVFDPLFTTKDGHVGLGLTISQRIIQDHAGIINIESEIGQGTRVSMEIPQERRRSIRIRRL